ncbi:hypothetical protein [Sneathiella sp.]|uniref:hypothetical protein n=1 Tax=Sneathiella sp. TaxID=1964365 RepID=UPI002FE3BC63
MKRLNRGLNAALLASDGLLSRVRSPKGPHILMACMPKTASTFLASAFAELPGFRRCRLTPDWGAREQELCAIRLSRYNHQRYVAQHHLKHSEWTATLIRKYNITPVVLVRDLADITMSIRDHMRRELVRGPIAFFETRHLHMPGDELEEAIVRLAIPWYLNFYVGWRVSGGAAIFDYDDYTADPVAVMAEILQLAGHPMPRGSIAEALAKVRGENTRFNVGRAGRGRALSAGAKEALLRSLDFYPWLADDPLFLKTRATLLAEAAPAL